MQRPVITGDSMVITVAGSNHRVDMVFRIKPGPGNYVSTGHMNSGIAKTPNGEAWSPYSPAGSLPYAHNWRLIRTPNDAFLAANTHREGTPLSDILQPAYAGLYSGAIHPTAEAHAIVADHVVRHVRAIVDKRESKREVVEGSAR